MSTAETRIERDTMGEMSVPAEALYGASTQRAVLNFPVSGRTVPEPIIVAYAHLKTAAARANASLDLLDEQRANAIVDACARVLRDDLPGGRMSHFPVDVFQTGSGTSTNMNVNEVVANLVCMANGAGFGSAKDPAYIESGGVHPNDHVNMGQSSNDTFPTAMHVAAAVEIKERLLPAARRLAGAFERKAEQFDHVVKIGRTHLQDATPIRLGQEFSGFASEVRRAEADLERAIDALCELAIGGTAVGTGINTHPRFAGLVCERLSNDLSLPFREAGNHFEAQHGRNAYLQASSSLRTLAMAISRSASDMRLMGCGPRCGIGELKLPAVQPGSSIMPGKVNPVIVESAVMVVCRVLANDRAIEIGALGGVGSLLDLNVAMPMMADAMHESISILTGACTILVDNLLDGLEADEARCQELIEGSLAMCTSLVPAIGYDKSAALAKQAYAEGKTVRQLALEQKLLPADELDRLLDPASMTRPMG